MEIIQDIKKKVGNDFPIIVKINANDYVEGGVTLEDVKVTQGNYCPALSAI